MGEGMVMAQS